MVISLYFAPNTTHKLCQLTKVIEVNIVYRSLHNP